MASELSQALKELNFTCSENLLQWPFDVPETRPIMQWLVESLNPAVVASLSPEEARMIHLINGDLKLLASVKQGKPPTRHNNLNGHLRGEMEMSKLSKTLIEIDDKIESVKNKISEIEDVQLELKKAAHNGYTELSDKAKQVESELLKSSNIISKSFEYSPPDDNAATRLAAIQIPSDITKPLGQGDESEDMNKMEALRAAALSEVVIHKAWKEYYLARNRPSEVAGGDGDATLDEKLLTSIRFKVATCKLMCKCLASSNSQALRVAILEYSLHKATQLHGQFENVQRSYRRNSMPCSKSTQSTKLYIYLKTVRISSWKANFVAWPTSNISSHAYTHSSRLLISRR